jgi:hypothetical protein
MSYGTAEAGADELSKEMQELVIDHLLDAAILIDTAQHSVKHLKVDRDYWRAAAVFRHWRRDKVEQAMPDAVTVLRCLKELNSELRLIGGNSADAVYEARAIVQALLESLEAQTV